MKLPLKSFLLWICLHFSALAADQGTPMADIEPQSLSSSPQASKFVAPAEEASAPAAAGSGLDDFAFTNKGSTGSGNPLTGPEAALPHLEGF